MWNSCSGQCTASLIHRDETDRGGRFSAFVNIGERFSRVLNATFSMDGKHVATAASDGLVRLWNVESRECVLELNAGAASCVSLSVGNRHVVVGEGKVVQIWQLESGRLLARYSNVSELMSIANDLPCIAIGDGAELAVVTSPNEIAMQAPTAKLSPWFLEACDCAAVSRTFVAWFPDSLSHLVAWPNARGWGGAIGRSIYILSLEGVQGIGPDAARS